MFILNVLPVVRSSYSGSHYLSEARWNMLHLPFLERVVALKGSSDYYSSLINGSIDDDGGELSTPDEICRAVVPDVYGTRLDQEV